MNVLSIPHRCWLLNSFFVWTVVCVCARAPRCAAVFLCFLFSCCCYLLKYVDAIEVLGGLDEPVPHGLLSRPECHPWVVVLLVRDVGTVRVSDLALEVVVVLGLVLSDSVPISPLGVGIDVHLDYTGLDGVLDVVDGTSAASVEDELHGLVAASELGRGASEERSDE